MNRTQLLAAMSAIIDKADAEGREPSTEEQAEFDGLKAKVDALDANAARRALVQASREAAPAAAAAAAAASTETPLAGVRKGGDEQAKEFENIGEFMHAVLIRPRDPRLATLWRDPETLAAARGLDRSAEQRMDTGNLGGFMVPEQFVQTIREIGTQGALIRPRAEVIAAGNPPDARITFPYLDQSASDSNVFGGVAVDWVDSEGGTKPATSGKLNTFSLAPNEWAAVLTVTDKLLRNWGAASSYFVSRIRKASLAFEDMNFFRTGTGVGRPLSIINSAAAIKINRTTSGKVVFEDIVAMLAKLLDDGGAVWSISRAQYANVVTLRNTIGSPAVGFGDLIFIGGDATKGIPDTLFGIPIYWNTRAPAAGSLGDVALLNLSHYIVKDGSGPFVASDGGIVNFANNKTLVKVFGNVDGQPDMKEPFTQEDGYTVSPFVLLN